MFEYMMELVLLSSILLVVTGFLTIFIVGSVSLIKQSIKDDYGSQVLVYQTNEVQVYARKNSPQMQELSDMIREFNCYTEAPYKVEWMSLLPNCHSIPLTFKFNNGKTLGMSEIIKMNHPDFKSSVESHLFNCWSKIEQKTSFKNMLNISQEAGA